MPPCSEELRRPENKGIKPYIDKLKQAKKAIDEGGAAVGRLALRALGSSCIGVAVMQSHPDASWCIMVATHGYLLSADPGAVSTSGLSLDCCKLRSNSGMQAVSSELGTEHQMLQCTRWTAVPVRAGQGPVSYADLLALGVKGTATLTWASIKVRLAVLQPVQTNGVPGLSMCTKAVVAPRELLSF